MRAMHLLTVVLLCRLLPSGAATAGEPRWRDDYNAARAEAQKVGKPLFLNFTNEWGQPCKKLEATTLKDARVQELLAEQFIAVRLDGKREGRLVEALRVRGFPTLILAAPEGKILKTVEGYLEADRLREHLEEALAGLANPEWMVRAYQDAARAAANGNRLQAVALLKNVLSDHQRRPIQEQARILLDDIEQQAHTQLAGIRRLQEREQHLEAVDRLARFLKDFAGTQAAAEAGELFAVAADRPEVKAARRTSRLADALARAKADFAAAHYLCCLERCEWLAVHHPDSPEGGEAVLLIEQIKSNPEWLAEATKSLADRLGELYLARAETYIRAGQPALAAECLEQLMDNLPHSRHADLARSRLAQIQGTPNVQAEFQDAKRNKPAGKP